MSGKDERRINKYPPDCPKCIKCHEWYLTGSTWILTERSMNRRALKHPVICFSKMPVRNFTEIKCLSCHTVYGSNTKIFEDVSLAYKNNYGDLYHRSPHCNGVRSDVWQR